jgi:glutamate-1-semialdehyde aminotransferase
VLLQPYAPYLWNVEPLRDVMPWFFARGEGARLWDENGRDFLDLEMGLGPTLLGYDHPVVREALSRHARTPAVTTLNHPSGRTSSVSSSAARCLSVAYCRHGSRWPATC